MRIKLLASVLTTALATSFGAAAAPPGSWATFNHDFQRTGHADVPANITTPPKIAWTLPMGALLGPQQAIVADVNGDNRPETITVTGGRITATKSDGTTLWSSALVSPTTVLGAWDLDGSGSVEVVADTTSGAIVLEGTDGRLLASFPATEAVEASFAPAGTGGFLILSSSSDLVSGYDFRNGTSVTAPSWSINGSIDPSTLVGDVDGDGSPDLVRALSAGFEVDDPTTGALKYSLPSMGPAAYFYNYELVDIDGQPGLEIVAVDTSYVYSPTCGIYVLGVRSGSLQTLWSATAAPSVSLGADFFTVAGSVANLDSSDGGGPLQVVYSQWGGTQWTTTIADASTGTVLGTIPGAFLQAVADIDGDGKSEIVTRAGVSGNQTPYRSTVSAYDFDNPQIGPVAKSWTLQNTRVTHTTYVQPIGAGIPIPVVADFDPATPGLELLVGVDQTMADSDTSLLVIHGADGSTASTYAVPPSVTPSIVAITSNATSTSSSNDLVLAQDDATVHIKDHALADHAVFSAGTYANWLRAIATPQNYANLYMAASNDHLLWIDGRHLHADGTPYVRFNEPHVVPISGAAAQGSPLDPVAYLNGPSPSIVTFEQNATQMSVVAHGLSGVTTWSTTLDPGSSVYVPGAYAIDLNGDGVDDLLLDVSDANSAQSLVAYDGTSGTLIASAPISSIVPNADELLPGSLADVNGDGKPDLVAPVHTLYQVESINLFAQPFASIWPVSQQPIIAVNGTVAASSLPDGGVSAFLRSDGNNGFGPLQRIALDGGVVASNNQGLPLVHGDDQNAAALVATSTPGSFDLVVTGTASAGLSRIRRVAGDTMNTVWTQYAANGSITPTAPSSAYALHEPVAVDLNGNGVDEVVFGSDDGYLYAVNSTDGSLVFSVNLGAPVSHVIAANVDLDPAVELVASLSDGRLIALDDSYQATQDPADAGVDGAVDASADASADASPDAGVDGAALDASRSDATADGPGGAVDGSSDGSEADASTTAGGGGGQGCGCSLPGDAEVPYELSASVGALFAMASAFARRRLRRRPEKE